MDNLGILINILSGAAGNLSSSAITFIIKKVFSSNPDLKDKFTNASNLKEFEEAFKELPGILKALADTGTILMDTNTISAIHSAQFDHQNGRISIKNSQISAPIIQMGGFGNGKTIITGNNQFQAKGSKAIMTGGICILTGNATIKMT